jgi:hypothetical protein
MDGQKSGFVIRCLQCGAETTIRPGIRDFEAEGIRFGTDVYDSDWMACRCGNMLEEDISYEPSTGRQQHQWCERSV